MEKTFAEFFAGIGLMKIGLEQQGWSIRYANDIDQQKHEMYKGHFQDADSHFVLEDIHKIKGSTVPTVTLATASFPCNDLSLAGSREGLEGKQSSAFWGFIRILNEMQNRRPPFVLLENVLGFLNSHNGNDFEQALPLPSKNILKARSASFPLKILSQLISLKSPPARRGIFFKYCKKSSKSITKDFQKRKQICRCVLR